MSLTPNSQATTKRIYAILCGMTKTDFSLSDAGRKPRLTPRLLLEIKRLSEPQMHPDGERVAFVVTEPDFEESFNVSHIWLTEWPIRAKEAEEAQGEGDAVAEDTAEAEMPKPEDLTRQLTFSRDGEDYPRWSPDGRYLAFLSERPDLTKTIDEDEEPVPQLWALPIAGGEAFCVTCTKEGVIDYAWTSDSESLVYLAPEPRPRPLESLRKEERDRRKVDPIVENEERLRRQFWRIEVENGKPKLLHNADYGVSEFTLAPDDSRLVYVTNRTGEPNDYHIGELVCVSLSDGTMTRLPGRGGDKTHLRWSPDGTRLAFLSWLDPALSYSRQSLFAIDLSADGETPASEYRRLTDPAFDYDLTGFEWCREDGAISALAAVGTGSEIVRIDVRTERLSADNATIMEDLNVDPDGTALVFVGESATAFPEIYVRGTDGLRHQLTRLNAQTTDDYALPRQEVVAWHSPDEMRIEGVLTYPNDYQEGVPYPLIVDIHGGPKGRALHRLRSYSHSAVWAAEGYAVLRPNFRGSEGYGHAFAIANHRDLGGGDFADIMAGVDWCIAQSIADPARLGVMGGSYGGYMTNWAIGHTDRFRAAISMFGIFHLQTDYSNSELSRWDNDYLGAYYWEDPEIYRRLSPGSYLTAIKTPTLILHGDEDSNTVLSNSKELYQALRHRGVTTQFVHYPREGHGLNEPNHRLDEIRRCLAWMDRFLKFDGKTHDRYRLHDTVPNPSGDLELRVTQAELTTFTGQPKQENVPKSDQTALLEVAITVHSPQPRPKDYSLTLSPETLRLESILNGESRTPIGLPLDLPGGKVLASTSDWSIAHSTDEDTGQFSLACAVVFRVPNAAGHVLFRVADFPPVVLEWVVDAEEAKHDLPG